MFNSLIPIIHLLIYVIFVLSSLRDKKFLIKTKDDSLTTTEVKSMILTAQKTYKDKNLRGNKKRFSFATEIGKDLVYGIATRFYPKSKYPLLELSVDETIMLTVYIKERLEDILNRRGLRTLKRFKIADMVNIANKSNKVMNSEAFKVTKEVGVVATKIKNVLNVINPILLVRKYIIGSTLNIITDKLCVVALAVIGEETYKIYSKSVFKKEVEIDSNVDEILSSIDEDFKNATKSTDEENIKEEIYIPEFNEIKFMTKSYTNDLNDNKPIDVIADMPLMIFNEKEDELDEEEQAQ